ncbi:hypothetical protein PR048_005271 [Dryococelus australis]|uniref:Uncharacterized protein n=1 Tax=Dryococelus australis TaxID=614101 RepID=A0ABQ9I8V4_9NEOP|nr:hypothetical protein PR048_005271 [Dryococelus australis]
MWRVRKEKYYRRHSQSEYESGARTPIHSVMGKWLCPRWQVLRPSSASGNTRSREERYEAGSLRAAHEVMVKLPASNINAKMADSNKMADSTKRDDWVLGGGGDMPKNLFVHNYSSNLPDYCKCRHLRSFAFNTRLNSNKVRKSCGSEEASNCAVKNREGTYFAQDTNWTSSTMCSSFAGSEVVGACVLATLLRPARLASPTRGSWRRGSVGEDSSGSPATGGVQSLRGRRGVWMSRACASRRYELARGAPEIHEGIPMLLGTMSRAHLHGYTNHLPLMRTRFDSRRGRSGFLHVGIVPDDAASRRVFSGISRYLCPFVLALLRTPLFTLIASQDLNIGELNSCPECFMQPTLLNPARRPTYYSTEHCKREVGEHIRDPVAEGILFSPPTKANRVQSPTG